MALFMKVNGKMIFLMVMESTIIIKQMKAISATGNKVVCMVKENIPLKTLKFIQGILNSI